MNSKSKKFSMVPDLGGSRLSRIYAALLKFFIGLMLAGLGVIYETIVFFGLFILSFWIQSGISSLTKAEYSVGSYNSFLWLIGIHMFLVVHIQVPLERLFGEAQFAQPAFNYVKKLIEPFVNLLNLLGAVCFGAAWAALIFIFSSEHMFCHCHGQQMMNELGFLRLRITLFYIPVSFMVYQFVRCYQLLQPKLYIVWNFLEFVFRFVTGCKSGWFDCERYLFALIFEAAEFIGAVLIPFILLKLWVDTYHLEEISAISTHSLRFYYACFSSSMFGLFVVYFLVSLERKFIRLKRDLGKGIEGRLLITFVVFTFAFFKLTRVYFVRHELDSDYCASLKLVVSFATSMNFVVYLGICFYTSSKAIAITCEGLAAKALAKTKTGFGKISANPPKYAGQLGGVNLFNTV